MDADRSELENEVRALVGRVLAGVLDDPEPARRDETSSIGAEGRIAIGADHGGFELKQDLAAKLADAGWVVDDCGTDSTAACDYPEFAHAVARRVGTGKSAVGIVVDGAGIGSAMVANKIPGVRAAACYDLSTARNSREHNRANVLTLGAGLDRTGTGVADRPGVAGDPMGRRPPSAPRCADPRDRGPLRQVGRMSDQPLDRELLIDLITREVLSTISGQLDRCDTAEGVRHVVVNGADRVAFHGDASEVPLDLAKYIDHTALKPETTAEQIDRLCAEAAEYGFASVCVNPYWVKRSAAALRGTDVKVCTVIGFPLGANTAEIKALEARRAIRDGAREVDMVINVGALKSGLHDVVRTDIEKVVDSAHEAGAIVKVILETALLTDEEKVIGSSLAKQARADFVKTSTGFGGGGATVYDVALMRETVGPDMGVKASGGVRTKSDVEDMIAAGATRIGASAGVQIVSGDSEDRKGDSGGNKY